MPVDAELVAKAVQKVLRDSLGAEIAAVKAEWAAVQSLNGWNVPPDDFELPAPATSDIQIGRIDTVIAESNFPAIWIYVLAESPVSAGEQSWAASNDLIVVRVLVQGLSVAHTSQLTYRYADAVRRTLMKNRTLKTAGLTLEPPDIAYLQEEEQGLYGAAQLEFPVKTVRAW